MKTVLVVDDFASVRFYHESLLKQGGYQTLAAVDGHEALAALEHTPVDLIMLDLMMPKMNGREFLRRLRSHPTSAKVPVLLITSDAECDHADITQQAGVCAVLHKPILPQNLLAKVGQLLAPPPLHVSS